MNEHHTVLVERSNHVGYGSTRRLAPYTAMNGDEDRRHDMGRRYIDKEIEHLREVLDQRMNLEKAALELQATEYERRLHELNHAHEMAREAAALTVSRDKFDAYMVTERLKWDEYVKTQDEKDAVAKRAYVAAGIAVAGMILTLALTIAGWLRQP